MRNEEQTAKLQEILSQTRTDCETSNRDRSRALELAKNADELAETAGVAPDDRKDRV